MVFCSILFNIHINDVEKRVNIKLMTFMEDVKLGGVRHMVK